jgi:hypothetical protein
VISQTVSDQEERATEEVIVRIAEGPLVGPVLSRVVSMVLARADWPLDRLDEALLVCDALCAHAPAYARNGRLAFSVQGDEQEAELRVLELTEEGAAGLLQAAMLPVVGNVLEHISERVSVEPDEHGDGSQLVLVLGV